MAQNFKVREFIARTRDGAQITEAEMVAFAQGISSGEISDPQLAAWTMAVYFQGLNPEALSALTKVMAESGETLDLSPIPGSIVDKHSTGGVGDKTTLVVAPLVASFSVPVIKLSGRALGHSGGTVDKLEAIPGLRTTMGQDEIVAQGKKLKLVLGGHSQRLAPLDAKIYQLRDQCATVESIPLIASSIISKKLAGGAQGFVFDVKVGAGAFMKTMEDAQELAGWLLELSHRAGKKAAALYSTMAEPLGFAIGNALEVEEAVLALKGQGPADLEELSVSLAQKMLALGGIEVTEEELGVKLQKGSAFALFEKMVAAQGGNLGRLPQAPYLAPYCAPVGGYVTNLEPRRLGLIARQLGSQGPGAGLVLQKKCGEQVEAGEPLVMIHAQTSDSLAWAQAEVAVCIEIGNEEPEKIPRLLRR